MGVEIKGVNTIITIQKLTEDIRTIVNRHCFFKMSGLTMSLRDDLMFDDNIIYELKNMIEKEFSIVIDPAEIRKWNIVQDIVNTVDEVLIQYGYTIIDRKEIPEI